MDKLKRFTDIDDGETSYRPVGAITIGQIIDRLAEYESTGLAPDEITETMALSSGDSKRAIAYECKKVDTSWLPYWVCHCGEQVSYAHTDETHYCKNCGQKLIYED